MSQEATDLIQSTDKDTAGADSIQTTPDNKTQAYYLLFI